MIDQKEIDKAMDAVDRVIFRHGKAWAIHSAYNQYLAEEYKLDGMPDGIAKSLLLYGAASALSCSLRSIAGSAFRPKERNENKAKTVYIKGVHPDSLYSAEEFLEEINKELRCRLLLV